MGKPLNEFGGWLVWFYVISWLSLIILAIIALLSLLTVFGANNGLDAVESLIYCIDFGIGAFLNFKIIKSIKIQEASTPNRVFRLMTWVLLLTVLFIIPELWLSFILNSGKQVAEIVKAGMRVVVWYFIWSLYFKKSKRVLAYYGKNSERLF